MNYNLIEKYRYELLSRYFRVTRNEDPIILVARFTIEINKTYISVFIIPYSQLIKCLVIIADCNRVSRWSSQC